jgi:hypothetical protein
MTGFTRILLLTFKNIVSLQLKESIWKDYEFFMQMKYFSIANKEIMQIPIFKKKFLRHHIFFGECRHSNLINLISFCLRFIVQIFL